MKTGAVFLCVLAITFPWMVCADPLKYVSITVANDTEFADELHIDSVKAYSANGDVLFPVHNGLEGDVLGSHDGSNSVYLNNARQLYIEMSVKQQHCTVLVENSASTVGAWSASKLIDASDTLCSFLNITTPTTDGGDTCYVIIDYNDSFS